MTELMLGNTAFGATPMGGSVKQIKELVTSTMMPKVMAAHSLDQKELNRLVGELNKCSSTKNRALKGSGIHQSKYRRESRLHKACRSEEAVKFATRKNCVTQQKSLYEVKNMKCKLFGTLARRIGTTKDNQGIVTKAGSEEVASYVTRISTTICGKHVHGTKGDKPATGGWGGGLEGGFLDQYLKAKDACQTAKNDYDSKLKECKLKVHQYNVKKAKCNQFQTLMDSASCKGAITAKDACETYAECYHSHFHTYKVAQRRVGIEEMDRKAEWRGLHRMSCLINAFADARVTGGEVDKCKKMVVDTAPLSMKYPKIPKMAKCKVTQLYPSTGAYKRAEFAPLPMLAKGKESMECSGVEEISTKPASGSPKTCKCRRVTMNGAYSAGPMVVCKNCLDVHMSTDKNSCPKGTKIFSPASRSDWATFLASAPALSAPNFIVDVTSSQSGCVGCKTQAMNSGSSVFKSWKTSDGSPWWLRSTAFSQPSGDYTANCYLSLSKPKNEDSITFNDGGCKYHSKSYYCQLKNVDLKPGAGSPPSCKCKKVDLAGSYSPGMLVKCEHCLKVSRSQEKNSCPSGMKLFSPRSREDWRTFLKSAKPLRNPNFIIDITRPQDGCGGCKKAAMKSTTPAQATWVTSDKSPWWLRSTTYSEPSGDYSANCYMDLWKTPHNTENNIQFNDARCKYNSRSYYCQPKLVEKKAPPAPAPPPLPVKLKVGNWLYATLDNVSPKAKLGTDKGLSSTTCHSKEFARAIPDGWEIAPFSKTVLDYPWSTRCMVFSNGKAYKTGGNRRKVKKCGGGQLAKDGNKYYVKKCSRRIVIRKQGMTDRQVKVGKYIYSTLDEVKPTAELYTDKGLSEDGCHSERFARAVPKGWELAPYNKDILKYPWSTYCLVFKDSKSYGTESYGSGKPCGGSKSSPLLASKGGKSGKGKRKGKGKGEEKFYAKHCNRRVAIRKKR